MRKLSEIEEVNTQGGEAITLAAVMALMAIGIVTVVVYKLFVSEKGAKVAIPGGFSFSWNQETNTLKAHPSSNREKKRSAKEWNR